MELLARPANRAGAGPSRPRASANRRGGQREIVQVRRGGFSKTRPALAVGSYRPQQIAALGSVHIVDGPYTPAMLRNKFVGRVIGIYSPNQLTVV